MRVLNKAHLFTSSPRPTQIDQTMHDLRANVRGGLKDFKASQDHAPSICNFHAAKTLQESVSGNTDDADRWIGEAPSGTSAQLTLALSSLESWTVVGASRSTSLFGASSSSRLAMACSILWRGAPNSS